MKNKHLIVVLSKVNIHSQRKEFNDCKRKKIAICMNKEKPGKEKNERAKIQARFMVIKAHYLNHKWNCFTRKTFKQWIHKI